MERLRKDVKGEEEGNRKRSQEVQYLKNRDNCSVAVSRG